MAINFTPAREFTQETRHLRIETGLAADALLLRRFSGVEGFSRLFHFEVDLLSHSGDIDPQDIVGDNVCITIEADDGEPRFFNAFVKSFQYAGLERRGLYNYRAELVPWFWFLSKRRDCRVFQNQTVQEIIETILGELGFSDYIFALIEQRLPLEYCVQYGESDLEFISRLLEHEGIYYFFEHEPDKHVLHFSDDASHYTELSPADIEHSSGERDARYINLWRHAYHYCSGSYAQTDFDFEKFNQSLITESPTTLRLKNNAAFPQFEFPGAYRETDQGRVLTKLRMQQEEMNYERIQAASNIHSLSPGKKFTLRSGENRVDDGKRFVVTEIEHIAYNPSYIESEQEQPRYRNRLVCIPADITYRPARITPKPRIDGVQTAVVVGKSGDEIYTDKYGRIKIQFHWDRYGAKNETSSCWVRVSTPWAGNKWGSVTIPRVGQEVIVTFVNGDPDQPLVIGSVYNSAHMPPYPLPESKSMMGMKSRSIKADGGSYNELVIDDTKGSEGFRINAQKDYNMKVGNDSSTHVVNNHTGKIDGNSSTTVQGNTTHTTDGNDSHTVGGDRSATVGGKQGVTIGSDSSLSVGGKSDVAIQGDASVVMASDNTVSVSGKQEISIGSNQKTSIGANQECDVGANQTIQVGAKQSVSALSQEVNISTSASLSALTVSVDGTTEIKLCVGGSSISITPAGITLSMGANSVKIDASGVSVAGLPKISLN